LYAVKVIFKGKDAEREAKVQCEQI
jgi:hypothetical protein